MKNVLRGWKNTGEMLMTLSEYNSLIFLSQEINRDCEISDPVYEEVPSISNNSDLPNRKESNV